jgi:hypothetical protein
MRRYQILMNQKELYEAWEERVANEMKIYVSNKACRGEKFPLTRIDFLIELMN